MPTSMPSGIATSTVTRTFIPLDKEKRLGVGLSEEVERSSRLLNDPAVTEYIDKVAQNVAKNSDARLPIVARVIDSDVANSFTLLGGYPIRQSRASSQVHERPP
jgi:predicted Zn-dependent protease